MIKEQEEAIETVKTYLHDWRDSLTDEDGYGAIVEEYDIEFINAVETVLNMLKEKDNIIKGKQSVIETQAENEEVLLNTLKKKDKQINLMARAFKQDDVRTVEEIKQYFERKSEE